ncbi:YfdQ family protein [Hafnia alvei]|uniref:DUF2303 family protein n=1 Tax=Hafnia alvei TaxID=569 RepID=A0A1C6Z580_HAFAL|nr:DUF2303 family protein [Hafnia alvei]NLS56393.1 DUF2303 family protein [Hafnia alvei]TBL67837.1 DUF2303 family protein [Hafnia alvei]SCM54237.1 Uncharacterized conserved protein YfdQ, DUF2303 family [Hafnia alvei]
MSQLDACTINKIQELTLSAFHLDPIKTTNCPAVIIPENHQIKSLEHLELGRSRFRGKLSTTSIADFVRYSSAYSEGQPGARCFIDADNMCATSVFNLGTLANAGHADNTAAIALKKTAPFCALLAFNGEKSNQKRLAEWLEDWSDFLTAFDAEGKVLPIKQAVSAVRRITIESVQSADHEAADFSGKQSLMQSVEAKSKEIMPVAFEFKCVPYEGLSERRFSLRNSILTGDTPLFVLRIVQLEAVEEEIANEFRDLLTEQFTGKSIETFIGNFKA